MFKQEAEYQVNSSNQTYKCDLDEGKTTQLTIPNEGFSKGRT